MFSAIRNNLLMVIGFVFGVGGILLNASFGCQNLGGGDAAGANLKANSAVIFAKREPHTDRYKTGELVVYFKPGDRERLIVGRIVGKPGDRVEIRNGQLSVNSETVATTIAANDLPPIDGLRVPRETVFIIGESANADDSRKHGPIPIWLLRGAVLNGG